MIKKQEEQLKKLKLEIDNKNNTIKKQKADLDRINKKLIVRVYRKTKKIIKKIIK